MLRSFSFFTHLCAKDVRGSGAKDFVRPHFIVLALILSDL